MTKECPECGSFLDENEKCPACGIIDEIEVCPEIHDKTITTLDCTPIERKYEESSRRLHEAINYKVKTLDHYREALAHYEGAKVLKDEALAHYEKAKALCRKADEVHLSIAEAFIEAGKNEASNRTHPTK